MSLTFGGVYPCFLLSDKNMVMFAKNKIIKHNLSKSKKTCLRLLSQIISSWSSGTLELKEPDPLNLEYIYSIMLKNWVMNMVGCVTVFFKHFMGQKGNSCECKRQ